MEQNIQQMIWDEIEKINTQREKLDAGLLSEQLVSLSVLYANLTKQIADFEYQYQGVIGMALDKDPSKPYNKIENECKRGEEHYKLKKAQALEKAVIQIIRASNKFIKSKEREQEAAKYQ